MPATQTTEDWDAAWTLTRRVSRKRLTDNFFDSYPTLDMLRSRGLELETGGKEIQEDVMYAGNSAQWFGKYATLNTDAVDGITAAFYPWAYVAVPITISLQEEQENMASDGKMKLLEAKTMQSTSTMRDTISTSIYGASASGSMLGLQDLVADAPTTGTVGGINRATNTWWRNTADTTATTFLTQTTTNVFDGFTRWQDVIDTVSEGNDVTTDLLTTRSITQAYKQALASQGYARTELNNGSSMGVSMPANPPFFGANVIGDRDCGASHSYMINRKFLKLKIQRGLNFSKTPFKEGPNQLAKVAYIVVAIQLVTNNPRRQGVATAVTGV